MSEVNCVIHSFTFWGFLNDIIMYWSFPVTSSDLFSSHNGLATEILENLIKTVPFYYPPREKKSYEATLIRAI